MASATKLETQIPTETAPADADTSVKAQFPPINIGTRSSKLAQIQARAVEDALRKAHPDRALNICPVLAQGDKDKVTPLQQLSQGENAKSLWTGELEAMLEQGEVDLIVHCLKDMPTQLPDNLALAAILEREDPRDALIVSPKLPKGTTLKDLPEGSTIGTSSVRRAAQLRRLYPSFNFIDLRGNVGTRLANLDAEDSPYTAIILAAAGLKRLGWDDRIAQYLSSDSGGMLHAVGQGALAIEIRKGDADVSKLVDHINCERTSRACSAERGLLRALEGGCSVPIGVETTWRGDGGNLDEQELVMKTLVVSVDGKEAVEYETARKVKSTEDAVALGKEVAKVLVEKGADKILEKISTEKQWAAKKQLEQMEETS